MTVHSTQLGAHQAIPAALTTLYTVPALTRTIVKSLWLRNATAGAVTCEIALVLAGGATVAFFQPLAASPATGSSVYLNLWVVLNAGDKLQVSGAAGSGVDAIASGAALST